ETEDGMDQPHVRVSLREISQQAPRSSIEFFSIKSKVIACFEQQRQLTFRFVELSAHDEVLDCPERAHRKGSFFGFKPVLRRIMVMVGVEEGSRANRLDDPLESTLHAWTRSILEAVSRQQEQAGIDGISSKKVDIGAQPFVVA